MKSAQEHRSTIAALLAEARTRAQNAQAENRAHMPRYMQGLDLETLSPNIESRLQEKLDALLPALLQTWLEQKLPEIARQEVREALGRTARVRPQSLRPENPTASLLPPSDLKAQLKKSD